MLSASTTAGIVELILKHKKNNYLVTVHAVNEKISKAYSKSRLRLAPLLKHVGSKRCQMSLWIGLKTAKKIPRETHVLLFWREKAIQRGLKDAMWQWATCGCRVFVSDWPTVADCRTPFRRSIYCCCGLPAKKHTAISPFSRSHAQTLGDAWMILPPSVFPNSLLKTLFRSNFDYSETLAFFIAATVHHSITETVSKKN